MTTQEKVLYHQVHPLKLATDISAQIVSFYFFWQHSLIVGLVTMFLPPIITSLILLNTVDFTAIQRSALGHYLRRTMTHAMEGVRLLGTLPIVVGAWYHLWWLVPIGLAITLFGWLRGLLTPWRTA